VYENYRLSVSFQSILKFTKFLPPILIDSNTATYTDDVAMLKVPGLCYLSLAINYLNGKTTTLSHVKYIPNVTTTLFLIHHAPRLTSSIYRVYLHVNPSTVRHR